MGAPPALPLGWQANEPASQSAGNRWLDEGVELLLPVPSALLPHATNYLTKPLSHRRRHT